MSKVQRHEISVQGDRGVVRVVAQSDGQRLGLVAVSPGIHGHRCMAQRLAEACEKAGGLAKEVHQELTRRDAARRN
jgi:hypothetical protein